MRTQLGAWLLAASLLTASVGAQERDRAGRIVRKQSARLAFMKQTGYPKGRPGYVIDHIIPLCLGGLDQPSNMQWQTIAEAKQKDIQERRDCRAFSPRP